ncbi:MAG: tyrosine-type recombinase/integrase [Desulfomonilaceae bacterium]
MPTLGKIYKNRGDRFFIRLPGGEQIWCDKQHRTFRGHDHARWTLDQIHGEMENGTFDPDFYSKTKKSVQSFAVYADQWLQRCERKVELGKLSKVHFRHLRHCVRNLFIPFFGELNLLDIRGKHVSGFWLTLEKAPKTIFNIMAALHKLFTDAHRDEVIQQIPNFPTELRASDLPEPDWNWASEEVQEQIFQHLDQEDLYFILFQACHGTRTGETRALQHQDVDFMNEAVTIRRAFSERDLKDHTKTKKNRTLPLDPLWKEIYLSRPRAIDPRGFVFTNSKGKPYSAKWMWRRWNEACNAAGVRGLTLYAGTRHSLASQAANKGVSIYKIAKFLGHTDTKTTQRYAHLDTNPLREVLRSANVIPLKKSNP